MFPCAMPDRAESSYLLRFRRWRKRLSIPPNAPKAVAIRSLLISDRAYVRQVPARLVTSYLHVRTGRNGRRRIGEETLQMRCVSLLTRIATGPIVFVQSERSVFGRIVTAAQAVSTRLKGQSSGIFSRCGKRRASALVGEC